MSNYCIGASCRINGYGDLFMDVDARPFINAACRIVKVTKRGLVQVRLQANEKKMHSFAKRNIDLLPWPAPMSSAPEPIQAPPKTPGVTKVDSAPEAGQEKRVPEPIGYISEKDFWLLTGEGGSAFIYSGQHSKAVIPVYAPIYPPKKAAICNSFGDIENCPLHGPQDRNESAAKPSLDAATMDRVASGETPRPEGCPHKGHTSALGGAAADKIIAAYLEHYSFPWQGESHMHDCITSVLETYLVDASITCEGANNG